MKMRLMFLKYILNEDEESMIHKFLMLQIRLPTRGDWASTCQDDLKQLEIIETFEDIKFMKINKFRQIVKQKIEKAALKYLTSKQGQKGGELEYIELEMSEYLQPNNSGLSIQQKRDMFAVMNRMVRINANFPTKNEEDICLCGSTENMQHIYSCELLNSEKVDLSYNCLYNGTLQQQLKVFKRFQNNYETLEQMKTDKSEKENSSHGIPDEEPLFSVRYGAY